MAAFVFSLEPVLEHRRNLEEEAQKTLAFVQIRLAECQGAKERLRQSRRDTSAEMYLRLQGGMADRERVIYSNYLLALDRDLAKLAELESRIKRELDLARRRLIEAMRRREIIEEVKKAEYRDFLKAEQMEEAKLYDELALRAFRLSQENLAGAERE
ncbi:MAG: flagellar biosynthesis chaperone [candidate division BRC1 bacterium ADurb.BinA364]|nr:MAG: flagellar biosynthesis chaperone [candidate division BRC1 bacterium ADurb.BinA364]